MADLQLNLPPLPLPSSERRAVMAKADLPKPERRHVLMAAVMTAVREASKLNLDQFSQRCGKDPRQIDRMEKGEERPQIEAVFAVEAFQPLVLEAMAAVIGHRVEVETTIHIRRSA